MGSRKYQCVARLEAVDRNRAMIIAAARELFADPAETFSIDAVARRAGVARMTVYHQFASKRGLLQALFDYLAGRSLVTRLRASFEKADPLEALDALIAAFAHFWHAERQVIRRLRAVMVTDADFDAEIKARDERRREHLRSIVRRAGLSGRAAKNAVDALHMLSSFETFDALAGNERSVRSVAKMIGRLARAVLSSAPNLGPRGREKTGLGTAQL
jgi:AcrR family transcriptional regulator